MVERGGTLTAEEKQLAKRYAVFFRIPRFGSNSPGFLPPDFYQQKRNASIKSENPSFTGQMEMQHQQGQTQERYPAPLDLSSQANYQTPIFDPQSFPPLQPMIYDGSNDLDFGFSDFFGGYRDTEFMLA